MITTWTYVQFILLLIGVAGFLAKRAPVGIIAGLWVAMMAWESYDMHPDHVVVYSVALFYAAHRAVHRPVPAKVKVST